MEWVCMKIRSFIISLCYLKLSFVCSSRVFLLGPSHHYHTTKCALSKATVYKTPIGDLPIDLEGLVYTLWWISFCYLFEWALTNFCTSSEVSFTKLAAPSFLTMLLIRFAWCYCYHWMSRCSRVNLFILMESWEWKIYTEVIDTTSLHRRCYESAFFVTDNF